MNIRLSQKFSTFCAISNIFVFLPLWPTIPHFCARKTSVSLTKLPRHSKIRPFSGSGKQAQDSQTPPQGLTTQPDSHLFCCKIYSDYTYGLFSCSLCVLSRSAVACMYVMYNDQVSDISSQKTDLAAARLLTARSSYCYCTYPISQPLLMLRSPLQVLVATLNLYVNIVGRCFYPRRAACLLFVYIRIILHQFSRYSKSRWFSW